MQASNIESKTSGTPLLTPWQRTITEDDMTAGASEATHSPSDWLLLDAPADQGVPMTRAQASQSTPMDSTSGAMTVAMPAHQAMPTTETHATQSRPVGIASVDYPLSSQQTEASRSRPSESGPGAMLVASSPSSQEAVVDTTEVQLLYLLLAVKPPAEQKHGLRTLMCSIIMAGNSANCAV